MFVICTPEQSEALLQELCDLERDLFSQLGLHFRILVRLRPAFCVCLPSLVP